MDKKQRNRLAILSALKECSGPTSSAAITELLESAGYDISERTVRLYLSEMDKARLTCSNGRRGRVITERGLDELRASQALQRVGYLSAKIDQMTYRMTFDLATRQGTVVVNTCVVDPAELGEHVEDICRVFEKGYAMGSRACLLGEGEGVGDVTIPSGKVGFCTVCSITLNGVLLKHGVPTASRFGGLLELREGQATRFVEMIHYDGTSIDPLEVFIRSGMTDYHGAIADGNGRIGASFREHPSDSRELITHLAGQLESIGLGAFQEIGLPGQAVLGVPVSSGRLGTIVIGGLNPVAVLEERNKRVFARALSGLMEYNRLHHYEELPARLGELTSTR
jgi:hypothetical protein